MFKPAVILSLIALIIFACGSPDQPGEVSQLKVSENHKYLMKKTGQPFFWFGDTAWLLLTKLTREEAETYLENRRRKGFNVVQVMVLQDIPQVNVYGDSALHNGDVTAPKVTPGKSPDDSSRYDYWDHVDFVIDRAAQKGLYMGLVLVWGSNVRAGKVNSAQAEVYASWLAERYKDRKNIVWLNGGDCRGDDSTAVWNTIGTTLQRGDPDHLVTFHPFGRTQSSMWFHDQSWLDFNMFQSGHRRYDQDDTGLAYGEDNWRYVRVDYNKIPVKPTLDGEPSYEGIPQGLHDPSEPYWTDDDVRRYAYWSVFAGACGFTYGHNAVMQMYRPGDDPAYGAREYWYQAIDAPGAGQLQHLKNLMLSYPYFERLPDQSLIAVDQGKRYNYLIATLGENHAFIYTYTDRNMSIQMGKIAGDIVNASWYNPRDGSYTEIGEVQNTGIRTFNPPGQPANGNDWVLVLEQVTHAY